MEEKMKRFAFIWLVTAIALLLLAQTQVKIYAQQTPAKIYAQQLVDEAIKRHTDVLVLAMHVTPPSSSDNVIIASNIGRIGKKADEDDLAVIKTGTPKLEVNKTGDRFEVELPLLDASRRSIGALGVVFPYKAGDDKAKRQQQAEQIRDELARRISHVENLMEPPQVDAQTPTNTYAQKLVDEMLAKYPELVILVMHVTPPDKPDTDNVILGSSIGRIGKKADEDDLRVIRTGKTNLEVNTTGERFEVELALQDKAGKTIGALGVVFPYKAGDDKAKRQKQAEQIRDELRKKIPSAAKLFEPA
jgi:hypothetical protein